MLKPKVMLTVTVLQIKMILVHLVLKLTTNSKTWMVVLIMSQITNLLLILTVME